MLPGLSSGGEGVSFSGAALGAAGGGGFTRSCRSACEAVGASGRTVVNFLERGVVATEWKTAEKQLCRATWRSG